jgi:hypothetical protein
LTCNSRVVGNPSLTKFAFRLLHCSYYGRVWRTVDHFAVEQSHQAFQVFDFVDRDSVEVEVPDRNVGGLKYVCSRVGFRLESTHAFWGVPYELAAKVVD